MKKSKVILTTIAIVAIVSGALAFKAKRDTNVYCKTSSAGTGTACLLRTNFTYEAGTEVGDTFYCTDTDPGTTGSCSTRSHLVDQQ